MKRMINIISNNISELNEDDMYTPIFQNTLQNITNLTNKARDQIVGLSIGL